MLPAATFRQRLDVALLWAGLTPAKLLNRCRSFPQEAVEIVVGAVDTKRMPTSAHVGAVYELAELLDVGYGWLLHGTPSVAARRLVRELELLDMGGRVGETGDIRVSASDYARILAHVQSVPGRCELDDTCERHPAAHSEDCATNGLGRAEGPGRARERSAPSEADHP